VSIESSRSRQPSRKEEDVRQFSRAQSEPRISVTVLSSPEHLRQVASSTSLASSLSQSSSEVSEEEVQEEHAETEKIERMPTEQQSSTRSRKPVSRVPVQPRRVTASPSISHPVSDDAKTPNDAPEVLYTKPKSYLEPEPERELVERPQTRRKTSLLSRKSTLEAARKPSVSLSSPSSHSSL